MHLELVIVGGPQAGRRFPLGRTPVTFGRSVGASISFPQDSFMSGMHLSVQYALSCIIVIDLRSSNGTFLNGQRIAQAMAVPGDVIKLGSLTLQVVAGQAPALEPEPVEPVTPPEVQPAAATPVMAAATLPMIEAIAEPSDEVAEELPAEMVAEPPAEAAAEPAAEPKVQQSLLRLLGDTKHPLFCLLDPGAHETLPALLGRAPEPKESLYDGGADNMLAKFAPYILQLGPDSELLHALAEKGWGLGWVCFFTSEATLAELGAHFRKFFMVQLEGGKEVYFRFYDPRVLRGFLPAASPEELVVFFGPVAEWLIEAKNSAMLLKITYDGNRLHTMTVPLAVTGPVARTSSPSQTGV